jgi:3-deoxy-D-manno-octulosonic-acid transferase
LQTEVIFVFYRVAQLIALPFLLLYVFGRAVRDSRYLRGLEERFGFWRPKQRTFPGAIWLHAVSVGEALSAIEIIRRIRQELPHTPVYVSCTTIAGREVAEAKLAGITDGIFYLPLDYCFAVRRVLRLIRPSVLVILETEIWPNLYREAKRSGASVLILNARMSDGAARRYANFRWFFSAAFAHVDDVLAQSSQDENRFIAAGARPEIVRVSGNLKYDFQPRPAGVPEALRDALRRPLWVAASTTAPARDGDVDEDDAVLSAYQKLRAEWPGLQLLIAPRKPERFDDVVAKLNACGLSYVRRSALNEGETAPVILLDSIGELSSLFPAADLVFMGGTLADRGGHNILEPALCGKPVIAGPHLENFSAIRDRFAAARGYVHIDSEEELVEAAGTLLRDPGLRESLGARARALAEAERGATARAMRVIAERRWEFIPRAFPVHAFAPFLRAISRLWVAGGAIKRSLTKPLTLSTPVLSVGGLAMGGVGKTPMVRYLAETLQARGFKPAVLTRGYGRQSREIVCLERGSQADVRVTGDEAQMLLKSCDVGIGADRWAVGVEMEKRFHPDVFLLDDGFQHERLWRSADLVLLDALDPFAGDAVFPLGRLREPVQALRRADLIVISRVGGRHFDGLRRRLPDVPLFLADVEISRWIPTVPPMDAVAAFCGLANPETFFETLRLAGARLVLTQTYPDHHRFTSAEMKGLAALARSRGATAVITTEKDWANLPGDAESSMYPLKLYRVEVRTRMRNESDFWTQLFPLLGLSSRANDGRASL